MEGEEKHKLDRDKAKNYHFFRSWSLPVVPRTQVQIEKFMNECEEKHRRWEMKFETGSVIIIAVETMIEFDGEED